MAPNIPTSSNDAAAGGSDVVSRIYLIRHGDRFDYANPSWQQTARDNGALVTDPPLSALGHRQASETANHLWKITTNNNNNNDGENGSENNNNSHHVDKILVSPYLRVIQTASPTSTILGIPLSIENGLSEAHATPGSVLPTPSQRFAYFPQINTAHSSLLHVQPTPGFTCPKTGHPCEAFAGRYCQRMETFASTLERTYYGQSIVMFSHAASVALIAALLKVSMRSLKFAPCGIFQLERVNDGPWKLARHGESNEEYVRENAATTYPWGFDEKHFKEEESGSGNGRGYWGSSVGIDLDYFVPTDEEVSKM